MTSLQFVMCTHEASGREEEMTSKINPKTKMKLIIVGPGPH